MDHDTACVETARALEGVSGEPPALIGFDGFIDHIIDVVDKRHDRDRYDPVPTIAELGRRISAASGQSANFELVVRRSKLGGNGPIMANAMACLGHEVVYLGAVGDGAVDPVFEPLAERAREVIPLGPPAVTDALEFDDGKLMLGKLQPMAAVHYDALVAVAGRRRLVELLASHPIVATVNWTMTLGMNEIWRRLAEDLLPEAGGARPLWFVDLADPAKRTREDLADALDALHALQRRADVVLGMNGSEGRQVLAVLGGRWSGRPEDPEAACRCCEEVRRALGVQRTMVHLVSSAATAWDGGAVWADGFYCSRPFITTGAGDHFNAGFVSGIGAGLDARQCLLLGGAASGVYVRTGRSPSRAEARDFLIDWASASRTRAGPSP